MKLTTAVKSRTFKVTFVTFPGATDGALLNALSGAIQWTNLPGALRNKINGTKLNAWNIQVREESGAVSLWRMFNRWMWKHGEEQGIAKIEFYEGRKLVETATLSGIMLTELGDITLRNPQKGDDGNNEFSVTFDPMTILWS